MPKIFTSYRSSWEHFNSLPRTSETLDELRDVIESLAPRSALGEEAFKLTLIHLERQLAREIAKAAK